MPRHEIEVVLIELLRAEDVLVDPIEGMRDLLRLNMQQQARDAVDSLLTRLVQRQGWLVRSRETLERLLDDGYPAVPQPDTTTVEALNDIAEQRRTVNAASAFFAGPDGPQAASLTATAGESRQK